MPVIVNKKDYRNCVGIMLLDKNNRVLIGKRNDMSQDAWQMPQGGIEEGENPINAALRELKEEMGISSDKVSVMAVADDYVYYDYPSFVTADIAKKYKGQRQIWVLLSFKGSDKDIQVDTDIPEFVEFKWETPLNVLNCIVDFKKDAYRQAFAQLLKIQL